MPWHKFAESSDYVVAEYVKRINNGAFKNNDGRTSADSKSAAASALAQRKK